eukprot:6201604-Pleurochrysis_carterae.AAC.1
MVLVNAGRRSCSTWAPCLRRCTMRSTASSSQVFNVILRYDLLLKLVPLSSGAALHASYMLFQRLDVLSYHFGSTMRAFRFRCIGSVHSLAHSDMLYLP